MPDMVVEFVDSGFPCRARIILVAGAFVINNIPNAPMMGIGITTLWLVVNHIQFAWKSNGFLFTSKVYC